MVEGDVLASLVQSLDGFVALAIAVWVIQIGITRMDSIQSEYREFVESVMNQQQANNDELMKLVSTLCTDVSLPERLRRNSGN